MTQLGIDHSDFAALDYDEESDRWGLNYGEMVAVLWSAVKAIDARIAA